MALDWLARREHTRQELRVKLVKKGCAETLAEQIVCALAVEGLVSDERFTESLMRVRRSRGYGPLRIRHELREKGVPTLVIEQWLDVPARDWIEDLKRVRRKKFGSAHPKSYAERAKQARFLQYRGFTSEQIQQGLAASGDVSEPRESD